MCAVKESLLKGFRILVKKYQKKKNTCEIHHLRTITPKTNRLAI